MASTAFSFVKQGGQMLRHHVYLVPLAVATALQSTMGISTAFWTCARKTDIILARWNKSERTEQIDWSHNSQILYVPEYSQKQVFKPREQNIQKLHDIIYEDGEYSTRV